MRKDQPSKENLRSAFQIFALTYQLGGRGVPIRSETAEANAKLQNSRSVCLCGSDDKGVPPPLQFHGETQAGMKVTKRANRCEKNAHIVIYQISLSAL